MKYCSSSLFLVAKSTLFLVFLAKQWGMEWLLTALDKSGQTPVISADAADSMLPTLTKDPVFTSALFLFNELTKSLNFKQRLVPTQLFSPLHRGKGS